MFIWQLSVSLFRVLVIISSPPDCSCRVWGHVTGLLSSIERDFWKCSSSASQKWREIQRCSPPSSRKLFNLTPCFVYLSQHCSKILEILWLFHAPQCNSTIKCSNIFSFDVGSLMGAKQPWQTGWLRRCPTVVLCTKMTFSRWVWESKIQGFVSLLTAWVECVLSPVPHSVLL